MKIGHLDIDDKLRAQSNSLILGSPGFGKSVFMELMMRKDLEQRQPFCFIDLHGSSFQRLKKWCAYNAYHDRRIILLDPSEGKYVKPYNPFRKKEGIETGVQSSSMVEAMLSVWGDKNPNSYPVMFKLMKILFTVMIEKGIPLHRGFQFLGDQKAMSSVVEQLSDANIKTLWADLAKLSSSEWIRQSTPTLNRLFRVVQSKAIQRFMCTQSDDTLTLTFEDTILVNLATSGELDSDAARTFAALLLNDLYLSAKRRKEG